MIILNPVASSDRVFILVTMTFNPKKSLYVLILAITFIGTCVPYIIFLQKGGDAKQLSVSEWTEIFFPSLFLVGSVRLLFVIKRIEIDHGIWTVTTLITGKKFVFSKEDVAEIKVFSTVSYKYRIKTGNLHIELYSRKKFKFSSNQFDDFRQLLVQGKKLKRPIADKKDSR